MSTIISSLFINSTILISFMSIGNLFMREKGVNPSSSPVRKILTGLVAGISGCLLMLYSIRVSPEAIIDFRYIPIIIMVFYASWESAMVSATVMGIFRIVYFGINKSSVVAIFILIVMICVLLTINRLKCKIWLKWIMAVLSLYIIFATGLVFFISGPRVIAEIIVPFYIGTAVVSFIMYVLSEHMDKSNSIYRKMKEDLKTDFLTGLNNVRQFDAHLNTALSITKARDQKLSMLFIDIDFFKRVNDTYGHQEGDLVLKELGNILTKECRSNDIISRNGGEEFSVILLDCPLKEAVEVAERIRKSVEQRDFVLSFGQKINITVSIGITTFPDITSDPEKLLEQADIALYNAKRSGRNRVVVSDN